MVVNVNNINRTAAILVFVVMSAVDGLTLFKRKLMRIVISGFNIGTFIFLLIGQSTSFMKL